MAFSKRPKTLLDILPDEIRRRIWELALVEDAHINTSDAILAAERYNSSKYRACRDGKELPPPPNDAVNSTYPRLQPALLATCHQIRREAFVIYYGENTFTVEMTHQLPAFIKQLDHKAFHVMKPIRVTIAPIEFWLQAKHYFATLYQPPLDPELPDESWAKPFCALPVHVKGEGTVYVTEAQLQKYFEEQVHQKMVKGKRDIVKVTTVCTIVRRACPRLGSRRRFSL
ncbi:hypothetical protein CLAFUW4_12315 [Fulvia fulva]|uniref:DUF7730 domain-containing protein n=1 Tax=Passalora fulva TaxID=5499 RepID=A0A9Q8USP8_PASFU|nr:uncharacterized protein CLAFUR5_11345 [Fulvia fulva]KAK4618058.1 hypothetical protein CLAFUR4_12320 [Fulvia fulva]KAK4618888.1 hypothetical protein CLAFUR0_12331 [Fulvia fulva]UJO21012.1 hypothetical protein CLAFUR5_11345 [Fulvia fulva]WPV17828.1 hypothetical protein CLAFUW4_12315 [Fulvia fulva]WPV33650.1 hypothetical protein CLAFUW7_12322 [Fulvia fulva]